MHRNAQSQFCDALIADGSAYDFIGMVMEETMKEDHLPAITREVYLNHAPKLHQRLSYDHGTALILLILLEDSERVIHYEKKEVGALIRFPKGATGNARGIALIDTLYKLPSLLNLNDAQILELEALLNKKGQSLNIDLPVLRSATDDEQEKGLFALALSVLEAKPKVSYQTYVDQMKAAGTPVTMTQKEFLAFAKEKLRP